MTELYPFQKKAVRKINHFDGRALLALEMGLGKSITSLTWVEENLARPCIIVCPKSLKWNWQQEIRTHLNRGSVILEGTKPPAQLRSRPKYVIINYDILQPWLKYLQSLQAWTVILDECHLLKNRKSRRYKMCKKLCKSVAYILALSGTPLTNRPAELWTTLNLLRPDIWPSFTTFGHTFCKPKRSFWGGWDFSGATRLPRLHSEASQYTMIRRTKNEVLKELPAKTRFTVPLGLSSSNEYRKAEKDFLRWLAQKSPAKAHRARNAGNLVKVGYLRRLAAELKLPSVFDWIDNYLEETDEKLAVFAIHQTVIKQLQQRYQKKCVVVDGTVTGKCRQIAVTQFQQPTSRSRLFIGQIQAAGVGINLTAADTMAFCEFPWTPGEAVQCEDRLHRIGQLRPISCYYLAALNTIESDLCKLLQKKQSVLDATLDGKRKTGANIFDQLVRDMKRRQRK